MMKNIAHTKYGAVEGLLTGGIRTWFGIPFARPPVGELRFKRPRECEPWQEVRSAKEFAPRPVQFINSKAVRKYPGNEDCLYVNVWAPRGKDSCPVFVYIYGGADVSGDGGDPAYDGTSFAENGVVYVTFNYRLGPLGFYDFSMYNNDFDSNCGVADQIMALKWVKENISSFGGDPENITICGESAGGTAVYNMLAAPSAKGLFCKAIAMSGLADDTLSPRQSRLNMELFLDRMGMNTREVGKLKTMEPGEMLEAAGWIYSHNNSVYPGIFVPGPVLDDLLPKKPWEAMAEGISCGVVCIFGTCRDEGSLFYKMKMIPRSWTEVARMLELNGYIGKLAEFRRVYGGMNEKKAMEAVSGDRLFWAHTVKCAEAQSLRGRIFAYRYDVEFPFTRWTGLGAMHGSDVGTALNTTKGFLNMISAGTSRKRRKRLRHYMHGSWINFAKTGDPNGTIPLRWEQYDTENRKTLIFNDVCTVETHPRAEAFALWKDIELYR